MNEFEQKIEVNINGVHCVITFIKEDNLKWRDDIIRVLTERKLKNKTVSYSSMILKDL